MHRIALILMVLLPAVAHAQLYKWVDENGHTQYSDRPPPAGVKSEMLSKGKQATVPPPVAPKPGATAASKELDLKKRQLTAEEKQKEEEQKAKEQAAHQENCDIARARLKTLEDGGRILKYDKVGERQYMSDEEIEQQKGPARAKAEEACKPL
jgi:uncharacterized protein DUF4124